MLQPEVSGVGTQAANQGAHSPGVSGVGAHPVIVVCTLPWALGLCPQAAGPLLVTLLKYFIPLEFIFVYCVIW